MYSPGDIPVLDTKEGVRRLENLFFPEGGFSAESVERYIRTEAKHLAVEVEVFKVDSWHAIGAHDDWFPADEDDPLSVFHRVVQFPEAGVNASRCEILLTVFAGAVLTSLDGKVDVVTGTPEDVNQGIRLLSSAFTRYRRVVAFKP